MTTRRPRLGNAVDTALETTNARSVSIPSARAAAGARALASRTAATTPSGAPGRRGIGSLRIGVPFVAVHLACVAALAVGWSPTAVALCATLYVTRAFGITVFYHRCLSHKAFRMARVPQAAGAVLGAAAAQRGPLWWVAHHRRHHRYTDLPGDPHSPVVDGMWRAHLVWLFDAVNQPTAVEEVPDLARYRELRVLDRFHHLVPALVALGCFGLGAFLSDVDPALHTSGVQLLVWGFCISTVALYHSTFAVNSIAHHFGRRRYETGDASRNNWVVSALTLGEGWHNNHHRCPTAARQGFGRFELDPGWWVIRCLAALRVATAVRMPDERVLADGGISTPRRARLLRR